MMPLPTLSDFAHRLADAARQETLRRPAASVAAWDKGNGAFFDLVTQADRDAERVMRALIEQEYPEHGIVGEEFGEKTGSGPHRWVLDPIDGTGSYTCGLPSWTTLIALLEDGRPVLGLIDAPALDERYFGSMNGSWQLSAGQRGPLRVSGCASLADARLSTTDPFLFNACALEKFRVLCRAVRTIRYGHDGYAYARLAAGSLDLVVESGLQPHDFNALIPVVRGAGGIFGNWAGSSDLDRGDVIAAASPQLYEAAVEIMGKAS